MSSTRNRLIQMLAEHDETYISGQFLSDELHISRSDIWKHMNELRKDGYEIEGKANNVNENTVSWGLQTDWLGRKMTHKASIPSTQRIAHELALDGAKHGTIVLADELTKGKGRVQKSFHSRKGQGIWMSIILRPDKIGRAHV